MWVVHSWKTFGGRPFVRKFVIIEFVPKCYMKICSLCTISLTTKKLMSVCFDLVKLLLLLEYGTTDLLSQNNLSSPSIFSSTRNLVTMFINQISWLDALKHVKNYVSMVDEAIRVYLALRQETTLSSNM